MESLDLTQMIKTSEEETTSEQSLDLPEVETEKEEVEVVETKKAETPKFDIGLIPLADWFAKNSNFPNVKLIGLNIKGVNAEDSLLFSVKSIKGGVDEKGEEKRELYLFKNSKNMVVPNIPAVAFDVYNNGFKLVYNIDNSLVKCYVLKTSLVIMYCSLYKNELIPFLKDKISKTDNGFNVNKISLADDILERKLTENADVESLHIKYAQIRKETDKIKTKSDAINWILNREKGVYDVNHLLQLDDLIIDVLK